MNNSRIRKVKNRIKNPMLCAALAFGLIAPAVSQARPPTFYSAQPEVFAIGDLHGDYYAMVKILRAANLIDSNNQWIGGTKTFVQVGDQLDRGDTEKEILDLFESLIDQAERAGGQVLVLNGNHETMNVELDFRYVTSEGFRQFDDYYTGQTDGDVRALPSSQRGRAVAFKPNGPYARKLAEHNSIVQIGETVFVHGGITPSHADYGIDRINSEISAWMYGDTSEPWSIGGSGPLWNRDYGSTVSSSDCSQLQNTLDKLNAKRLVIAHTRQRTINQACDGRVWRVDVGMSSYYGGKLQALKITNDDLIQIVEENGQLTETGYGSGDGGNNCAKPSKPQLPVASNIGSASYRLSWSATSNAEKYQVQRWSESNAAWQNIAKTSATSYLISGEQRVKAYARVIGINDCDVSGTPSDWIEVTMATSGGGDSCPSGFTEYSGTIQSNGTAKLFEAGYYYSEPGVHELINIGRAVTMNLYQWDGSNWQLKSSSGSELSYEGLTGYYYPYLSGTANQRYRVCLNRP